MRSIRVFGCALPPMVIGMMIIGALFALGACAPRAETPIAAPTAPAATDTSQPATPTALPTATPPATPASTPTPETTHTPTVLLMTPTAALSPAATLNAAEQARCGSLVAYVREGGLWLMNADGSDQRALAPGANGRPTWSPDGRSLAYQPDGAPGLRIADVISGRVRAAAAREGCFATDPAWSPDGGTIAFRQVCGPDESAAGKLVFLDTATGSTSAELLADISSPTWSPDGAQIALIQGRAGRFPGTSILICARDGTGCVTFSDRDYVKSITWSPDGQFIAATVVGDPADTSGASGGAATPKVRLLPLKGGKEQVLTGMDPAWAPDSKRLLRTAGRYGLAIYVVDIGGAKYQELAPGASPAWQRCDQKTAAPEGEQSSYRGWSIYDAKKESPFEVRFSAIDWLLDGSLLRHKQIPGCELNLNPAPTGAEMCGAPVEGVSTFGRSTWDWKAFKCPKTGMVAYHTSVESLEYIMLASWSRKLSQDALAQCRAAAEAMIGTFSTSAMPPASSASPTPEASPAVAASTAAKPAGRILFLSNRDRPNDKVYQDGTEHELYIMDADGRNQTRLSTELRIRYSERLSVSPDGARILIDKDTPSGQFALSYVPLAEPDLRVKLADGFASSPVWSPDGRRIAYCAGSGSGGEQVIVMNADGSDARPLTNDGSRHLFVDWSPDGSKLAFMRDYQLYVMNIDGSDQRPLLAGFARNLAWSPDGTMIAFESGARLDDQQGNGGDIWVVNADGSNPRNLTHSPDFYDAGPAWSPDSATIAFSSQNRRVGLSKAQIARVGLSDGQMIYLTDVGDNRVPVWVK